MKYSIRNRFLLLVIIALTQIDLQAGSSPRLQEKSRFTATSQTDKSKNIYYKVIRAAGDSYGYDIYVDGKLYIHQLTIPGMPGNHGFRSKESAEKVAQLVKDKLLKGEARPTVTMAELKQLKTI